MYAPFHFSHTRFIGVYHYLKKQRVCFMSTNPLRLDAWTAEKYAINKELCGKWTSKRALDYFFNVLRRRSGKKTQEKQTNKDIEGKDWIIKKIRHNTGDLFIICNNKNFPFLRFILSSGLFASVFTLWFIYNLHWWV